MKNLVYTALFGLLLLGSAFVFSPANWKVQEDAYQVKIVCSKFEGVFKGLKTNLQFDENNLAASRIEASIESNTINTGNAMRNRHAMQGLDAKEFPIIRFESTSIVKKGDGYEATGNLTIRDVTRSIQLPFTFVRADGKATFAGSFSVKPKDYKVKKMGTPDEFTVQLQVPVQL